MLRSLILVFVLPPAFGALGTVFMASAAPAWLDPIFRSRFTVGLVLGLRMTPIAGVILLRAVSAASPFWALAAAVHGVPLGTYLRKVLGPILAAPLAVSGALVVLLATADVTTVLLLPEVANCPASQTAASSSSLDQNPEKGGRPEMAKVPRSMVQKVHGMYLRSPPILNIS